MPLSPLKAQDVPEEQAEEKDNPAPIFQHDDPLQIRIEAPFSDIFRSRGDAAEYFPAMLYYPGVDGVEVATELRIKTRGNFRNRVHICRFPPLMLDFPRAEIATTIFAGENHIKLVTHCQARERYYDYVLLEYLNYRVLNLLTDYSLKVRLLELTYINSDSQRTIAGTYGFLLEDIERMAARLQLAEVKLNNVDVDWYDQEHEVLVALFQYLLGNTDRSLVVGDPGEVCCHNVYPLQGEHTALLPIPYDFDVTGIVNPDYAEAPRQLGIRRLTQRLYRGACPPPEALEQAVNLFIEKQGAIRALYAEQPGLTDFARNRVLTYIDEFFSVIADSAQVENNILSACRTYNE
jgi:hypothetical protein